MLNEHSLVLVNETKYTANFQSSVPETEISSMPPTPSSPEEKVMRSKQELTTVSPPEEMQ
jgi:hypothetical protein